MLRGRTKALLQPLGAEAMGTFALTLAACAVEGIAASSTEVTFLERGLAAGLTVLFATYAFSDISGAHINPAVTIAFAAHGAFEWRRVPGYWLAQAMGAVGAAALSTVLTRTPAAVTTESLTVTPTNGLLVEIVATLLLVTVILHTSKRKGTVGAQSAIAVGSTIVVANLWAGPLTGASMNPARSFGPALLGHHWGSLWVYALGPLGGALLAVLLAFGLRGSASQAERTSAEGEARE